MKILFITLLAAAASASIAPLYTMKDKLESSYIIVLKDGRSLSKTVEHIKNSPFFAGMGGSIKREYGTVLNGFSAILSEKALDFIRRMDAVKYVEEDGIAHTTVSAGSWGIDRIDQQSNILDNIYNCPGYKHGSGAHVYVIDTGIRATHTTFQGRASVAYDAIGGDGVDCNGHGTHCAGTVAGATFGVADDVEVYGVRVLGCWGFGSFDGIIDGMNWVANNGNRPAVASMSLGGGFSLAVNDAVAGLVASGVATVVAAGNDNADACNSSPASAPQAITVAATDSTDARSSFSNYGSCVTLFAPGSSITSAWYDSDTSERTISGTSMATPHVAGAIALALAEDPTRTPEQAAVRVMDNTLVDIISDPKAGTPNAMLYVEI